MWKSVSHRSSFNVTIGLSFGENDSKHVKFQHVRGLHKCTLPTFIVARWLQRHKNHNVITNKIRKLRLTASCYRLYRHLKWTRTLFACISNDAKHLVKIYAARASEVLRQRCIKITSCFNGRLLPPVGQLNRSHDSRSDWWTEVLSDTLFIGLQRVFFSYEEGF